MNKETKILVAIAYVFGVYLILKNKKSSENKLVTSNPSANTPNIVPAPISPNVKSTDKLSKEVLIENMPIVKQTPFIPTLPKPGGALTKESVEQQQKYRDYRPSTTMTKEEFAECLKDGSKCKF
jgi:hypothetical protein